MKSFLLSALGGLGVVTKSKSYDSTGNSFPVALFLRKGQDYSRHYLFCTLSHHHRLDTSRHLGNQHIHC